MTEEQAANFDMLGLALGSLPDSGLSEMIARFAQLQKRRNQRLKRLAQSCPLMPTVDDRPTKAREKKGKGESP